MRSRWEVRLSADAALDFDNALLWTAEKFGLDQAHAYAETLANALDALRDGPEVVGATLRRDIEDGLYMLHIARNRRHGRHFILYRVTERQRHRIISVLRILHDAMDISRDALPHDDQE